VFQSDSERLASVLRRSDWFVTVTDCAQCRGQDITAVRGTAMMWVEFDADDGPPVTAVVDARRTEHNDPLDPMVLPDGG